MKKYKEFFTVIGHIDDADLSKETVLHYMPMFRQERNLPFDKIIAEKSDLTAVLIDAGDQRLVRNPLINAPYCTGVKSAPGLAVRGYIPYDERTRKIDFEFKGRVISEFTVAKRVPDVKITSKINGYLEKEDIELRWDVDYRGENEIQSKVYFSNNDGETWQVVGSRTEKQSMSIDPSTLKGGKLCCFKIKITDGYNNSSTESERFVVQAVPPQVSILNPLEGDTLSFSRGVMLNGQAFDPNTEEEIMENLLWQSSKDGKLNYGQLVQIKLSKGEHIISLTAFSKNGLEGSDIARVVVK